MEIGAPRPIFKPENIKESMGQWYTYYTIWEHNIVAILHIYGARDLSLLFVITQTLNVSPMKLKWSYFNQYSPIKVYQRIYGRIIFILYNTGETYCVSYYYLWSFSYFSTILWSPIRWIWVMRNRNWCRSTNINTEPPPPRIYGTIISIVYKMGENNCGNSLYVWR